MRELKFRRCSNGEPVYFDLTNYCKEGTHLEIECFMFAEGPIEQYTGLKDRNGKEIWEGDIVKGLSNTKMVVTWLNEDNREAFFMPFGCANSCGCCGGYEDFLKPEIIGNIHENPELLDGA
jgi:hypothetical protein